VLNPDDVYDYREPVDYVDVIDYETYQEGGKTVTVAKNQTSATYSSSVPVPDDEDWPSDKTYPYPYVIITNDKGYYQTPTGIDEVNVNLTTAVDDLVEWKTDKGVPVVVKTVDDIKTEYPQDGGEYWDPQVAIRKFLKDAITNWGPEYVCLIGDVDKLQGNYSSDWGRYGVVPIRVLCESECSAQNPPSSWTEVIPSDLYYTDFNDQPGDWDYDGDGIFGERWGDQIDKFKPDLACGWIPADTTTELSNYIDKVLKYEKDPVLTTISGKTYMRRFLHVLTDQGFESDYYPELNTPGFVPTTFTKTLMYETPRTGEGFAGPRPTYPEPHDLNDALEEGYGITEIDCHGHPWFHYILTRGVDDGNIQVWEAEPDLLHGNFHNVIYPDSAADLTTDRYGIIVTISCKTNCFSYNNRYDPDSIAEHFLFDSNGGGVAYLGNTRDGYWGTSGYYSQEFYKTLFHENNDPDDDYYFLGPLEIWSRARFLAKNNPLPLHETYTHMLCGDPELNLWTDDPGELDLDVTVEEGTGGMYDIKVTVKDENTPANKIYLAYVCLNAGEDAYLINLSNENGRCDLQVPADAEGTITATKRNWVPAQEPFTAE